MFRSSAALALLLVACEGGWTQTEAALHTEKRVGIGTAKPEAALAVNGSVIAQEVKVTVEGWPDYVFEDSYPLPSFDELAEHVRREKRLPRMPSASEVAADGVSVGASQKLLLEKVEELTLYVLALERENDALRERVTALERRSAR